MFESIIPKTLQQKSAFDQRTNLKANAEMPRE